MNNLSAQSLLLDMAIFDWSAAAELDKSFARL